MTGVAALGAYVDRVWADDIIAALSDYITIPNVSVAFDPDWKAHGFMDRAVELVTSWCAARDVAGMAVTVNELPGLTPMIVIEVPASGGASDDDTVLLYGHIDKQPEMTGWRDGLGPWTPVVEHERLYGRGGADDGYAAFASLLAIEAAQACGLPHSRCVILIEASEESGSCDLPAHLESLAERLGTPSLVLCLDSGCLDDQRLWVTTSLRGMVAGELHVEILREGVHSGDASGVVPSSFRIVRQLLERIEDSTTGAVLLPELCVEIPPDRVAEAADTAREFSIGDHFPFVDGARPAAESATEQLLARTWRPTLCVTGAGGIPPIEIAGNVLRPYSSLQLSVRLPPTCDHERALEALRAAVTDDPPYGARVQLRTMKSAPGWNAPAFEPWLLEALDEASNHEFGRPARACGEGGTIPFMGMLGEQFPDAQFVITGVLVPGSNAHGPNEFLDLQTARRLTRVLARVLAAHASRGDASAP
jgi:acetylornithine deacetylase/succinyl-diaminopimelate desuccinylase-like protein